MLAAALLQLACESGDPPRRFAEVERQVGRNGGRLYVLRFRPDGVQVLRRLELRRAPRPLRARPRGARAVAVVRDARGRELGRRFFRLPRRRHALFGNVDGPARAVDVALRAPVVHLRVVWPDGASVLELWEGSRRLGEVVE
jgi:hypothetical protein